MKFAKRTFITAMALFTLLALPLNLAAQENHANHHHYKLIDIGTFGAPTAALSYPLQGAGS